MRPIGFGCQEHHHAHELIVAGRPVPDGPGVAGLLTLWRCPTVHGLGGYWHDLRRNPETSAGSGPPLDSIPEP